MAKWIGKKGDESFIIFMEQVANKSYSIAAASIIAKVTRDRLMESLAIDYPVYDWHKNSGYGTKYHLEAIQKHGITIHHRKSFAPIKNIVL